MELQPRARFDWKLRTRTLKLGERTLIMGIVNVTPDSFSDGGKFTDINTALAHALHLLDTGADIIDIGGESTRPGAGAGTADAISAEEEQSRILPLIKALLHARPNAIVSVDTYRASTADAAVKAGAEIVNDVSGVLWDVRMAGTCAGLNCGVIAMHTRGLPSEWAAQPNLAPGEILPMVRGGLRASAAQLMLAGVDRPHIVLDPGFGFGKRGAANWQLLRDLAKLRDLRFPLMVGVSRKGFIHDTVQHLEKTTQAPEATRRDGATAAVNVAAVLAGAHIVRVHDAMRTAHAVAVADALLRFETA